ncbi:mitochondrial glutathione transporter SLC25A40 [Denticeps clupeoides]|uniref:Mitochondrial glutathione transporter SLC25A40 n=1 Tax=Denticeps clupeoides TaxID=299321 RepID=A0AAY4A7D6_9TELE|nr:solute carrier family 25 member 40 [Denticeps clupeoides]XP_028833101.1 solute carrier family 25 member 40 [Denticeps clupeoides]XP_028833102.1 solute carrier family 25 member 40 [Denticeps clupeoides]XP_028833103.1 solute carrier family 25 member 40 [Denticeps clupeoides]XP_028833104.1 solute carrier family 25 member 40 [Denticeps clupeoides]
MFPNSTQWSGRLARGEMASSSCPPPESGAITPLQQMLASCSGAVITSLFVTPLDVVKIRLQAQKTPLSKGKCFVYCNGLMDHICVCENGNSKPWYRAPGHFNGTVDAFVQIVRREGIKSLWSGLPPTLVMAVPATVIYFTCYDQLCVLLRRQMGANADKAPLLAGAVARVFSATLISPLELIRTKLQSERQSYRQLSAVIRSSLVNDGWLSLWRGWGPTILRDVPFSAMYWYNYEKSKAWLCELYNTREPTFTISFTSGAASGAVASVVTLPFDVVKTRRQVELGELQAKNLPVKASSSTLYVMKRIIAENGFTGLFAGFLPRLIKVAPACAIMISTYEFGKRFFRQRNQEREHSLVNLHTGNT